VRVDRVAGQPNKVKAGLPRAYDSEPKAALPDEEGGINLMPEIFNKTYLFVRGDENDPDKSRVIEPGVPRAIGGAAVKIAPVELTVEAYYPDSRSFVAVDLVTQAKAAVKAVEERLAKAQTELEQARRDVTVPDVQTPGPKVDFDKQIKPLFVERCASCHLGRSSKAGLSLVSVQSILTGGKSGPAVVAGKSAESLLLASLKGERQPRMPLNGAALDDGQMALLARWIDQLPRKMPAQIVKEHPGLIAATEKELAATRASLTALEARVLAEQARLSKPGQPETAALAEQAQAAEREANLLQGEEQVFRAQQKLTEAVSSPMPKDEEQRKSRERAIAAAKKNLETAVAALSKPADEYSPLGPQYPKVSSGRRLGLARWIASRENPLTARVAVNHIWMRHFGKPLVPSVIDFGKNGKQPTHPELLDWLAAEFMESGWSMKKLHRLLVTSKAYKRESGVASTEYASLKIDPDNTYLWRMNPRRLEAEAIRDSVLQVSGSLDLTMGGPDLNEDNQQETPRRSLYFRITPSAQMQFLKVFDGADPTACYRRSESIMPQQALALANSALSLEQARILADKLAGASDFLGAAYLAVLSRPPSAAEREKSLAYMTGFASAEKARASLVHALFNRNEFVTVR
jgi:hypothetical protein